MRWRFLIAVAAAACIVTGCTVTRHGSAIVAPQASTTPSIVTATPTRCPVDWIRDEAGPFCYPLPTDWADYSSLTNYGAQWTYRTLVSVGVHDLIEVDAIRLDFETDALSDVVLADVYERGPVLVVGRYQLVQASPTVSLRIDGARAFSQSGVYRTGGHVRQVTVYKGHTWLSISCQSLAKSAAVTAACSSTLSHIRIDRLS
jgi:hypothetical protein